MVFSTIWQIVDGITLPKSIGGFSRSPRWVERSTDTSCSYDATGMASQADPRRCSCPVHTRKWRGLGHLDDGDVIPGRLVWCTVNQKGFRTFGDFDRNAVQGSLGIAAYTVAPVWPFGWLQWLRYVERVDVCMQIGLCYTMVDARKSPARWLLGSKEGPTD